MKVNGWLRSIADAGKELLRRERRRPEQESLTDLCRALYSHKGYAMGTALAGELIQAYRLAGSEQRLEFFDLLLNEFGPDAELIIRQAESYKVHRDLASFRKLTAAVEPPRQHLLRRINMGLDGTRTILEMRLELLRLLKESPEFEAIDDDLQHLLASWFNPGFQQLRKINWDTPAKILEKIIAYEAVHKMAGWEDLRRRLEDDRRCFAFFHPALPDEPIIFVEVALLQGLADAIQPILAPRAEGPDTPTPDTAIFYSISNCQPGLRGVNLGNFLIKQVVLELQAELPELQHFATLSPIPGFRDWLRSLLNDQNSHPNTPLDSFHIGEEERAALATLEPPGWQPAAAEETLRALLLRLCAHYLYHEKREGKPLDPVARFHLGNGAAIERLNWAGDLSAKGIAQSAGILVNYRYDLDSVERHHEQYIADGSIAASATFKQLV